MARKYICRNCNEPGHNKRTCPLPLRKDVKPSVTRCGNCGEAGHNSRTCGNALAPPKPKKPKDRRKLNIEEKYPGLSALVGTKPDSELGRQYGVSRETIRLIRMRLGVPTYSPMGDIDVNLLGTMTDGDLAKKYGRNKASITVYRRRLGIASFRERQKNEVTERIEEHLDLLGKISDPEFAKLCGVGAAKVFHYRQRHGIKTEIKAGPWSYNGEETMRRVVELYEKGLSDEEIAAELGRTPRTIGNYRWRLGLGSTGSRRRMTEEDKKRVLKVYRRTRSVRRTAEDTGWSRGAVSRLVKKEYK